MHCTPGRQGGRRRCPRGCREGGGGAEGAAGLGFGEGGRQGQTAGGVQGQVRPGCPPPHQLVQLVCPSSSVMLPAGQGVHWAEPSPVAKVPAWRGRWGAASVKPALPTAASTVWHAAPPKAHQGGRGCTRCHRHRPPRGKCRACTCSGGVRHVWAIAQAKAATACSARQPTELLHCMHWSFLRPLT